MFAATAKKHNVLFYKRVLGKRCQEPFSGVSRFFATENTNFLATYEELEVKK
jgi:hypothetical protein